MWPDEREQQDREDERLLRGILWGLTLTAAAAFVFAALTCV